MYCYYIGTLLRFFTTVFSTNHATIRKIDERNYASRFDVHTTSANHYY